MEKVSLDEKFAAFSEHWRPKIVGALNGQEVKVVKFQGVFRGIITSARTSYSWSGADGCEWSFGSAWSS